MSIRVYDSCGPASTGRGASVSAFFRNLFAAWRTARAMREMESLPFDVRKDIGWRA